MKLTGEQWKYPRHLQALNEAFLRVAAGETRRLAVFMPPRHGKSEYISRYAPAWYLGHFPDRRIMECGYGDKFAQHWGRRVRDTLGQANRMGVFDVRVRGDLHAADKWELAGHEGGMLAAGVGGAITGMGANLLLIDDPVKSRQDAESRAYRERVWDWYRSDAYTRLEPGGAIILVQTRWHVDDLAGRILNGDNDEDDQEWEVLSFPALAEEGDPLGRAPGEALWPERYDAEELRRTQRAMGGYLFGALYQQTPTQREGGMFKREWFRIVDAAPATGQRVRGWDLGGTEAGGDFTTGVRMLESGGSYFVEDVIAEQYGPAGVRNLVDTTAQQDGRDVKQALPQDPGQAGKAQVQEFTRLLAGYVVVTSPETGSKTLRAEAWAAQCEAGNVALVRGPWNERYIDQLCQFKPYVEEQDDDIVDGNSRAFGALTGQRTGFWQDEGYVAELRGETA